MVNRRGVKAKSSAAAMQLLNDNNTVAASLGTEMQSIVDASNDGVFYQ
jgi:hypothetical protein